jgi:hypothetical protein
VRTGLKGEGGVPRAATYDIFPPPGDVIPPNGVPWRSDPATPQIGEYLAGVLVDRIAGILEREFPRHDVAGSGAGPVPGPGAAVGEGALRGG